MRALSLLAVGQAGSLPDPLVETPLGKSVSGLPGLESQKPGTTTFHVLPGATCADGSDYFYAVTVGEKARPGPRGYEKVSFYVFSNSEL